MATRNLRLASRRKKRKEEPKPKPKPKPNRAIVRIMPKPRKLTAAQAAEARIPRNNTPPLPKEGQSKMMTRGTAPTNAGSRRQATGGRQTTGSSKHATSSNAAKVVAASPSRPRYKSPAVAKVRAIGAALGRASVRNKTVNKALNRATTEGKAVRRKTTNVVRAVQAEGAALGRASVRTKPAEMNAARIAAQSRKRAGVPARARKATPVTPAERRRKKRKK